MSTIFPHKKAVLERHTSESRQECENKTKEAKLRCLSKCFFFSKSFNYIFQNLTRWTEPRKVTNKVTHTHCLVCWLLQFLEKLQRSCLTVSIFFDCTFLCSSFDFGFESIWFKRHVTSNHITVYSGWAQWRRNMAAVLPNMDIGYPRWRISNWSKTGMFFLIPQSLSANSQNELCFPTLRIWSVILKTSCFWSAVLL